MSRVYKPMGKIDNTRAHNIPVQYNNINIGSSYIVMYILYHTTVCDDDDADNNNNRFYYTCM